MVLIGDYSGEGIGTWFFGLAWLSWLVIRTTFGSSFLGGPQFL
jgi:hypothetical protein